MARKSKSKSKVVKKQTPKKNTSALIRILEAVVVLGSLAALAVKFFKGKKSK